MYGPVPNRGLTDGGFGVGEAGTAPVRRTRSGRYGLAREPLACAWSRFSTAVGMQSPQDHRDMPFHGAHADPELARDRLVRTGRGDQAQDVELSRSEVELADAWRSSRPLGRRGRALPQVSRVNRNAAN